MKKEVQIKGSSDNLDLNLVVYTQIKLGLSPKEICKKLNWKKSRLSYYTRKLQEQGYIENVGYGTWQTSSKSYPYGLATYPQKISALGATLKEVQKSYPILSSKRSSKVGNTKKKKEIRSHGFRFTINIPRIHRWKERKIYLDQHNIPNKVIPQGIRINLDHYSHNFKIWLCRNSIVVHFPTSKSYLVHSAENGYLKAVYDFKKIVKRLEGVLNANLRIGKEYQFKVSKRHHSHIQNSLAKHYNKTDQRLQVRDSEGRLWLLIDNSFNLNELEVVGPSKEDNQETLMSDVVIPFFNQTKTTRLMPNMILERFNQVGDALDKLQLIQGKEVNKMAFYNDNFVKHIDVLDQLGLAVSHLVQEITNIKDLLPKKEVTAEDIIIQVKGPDDFFKQNIKTLVKALSTEERVKFADLFIKKFSGGDLSE